MQALPVGDPSQVAPARRAAAARAAALGFDETGCGRVALVATELCTNLVRHGDGGQLLLDGFADGDGTGIDLIAVDRGRGMADPARCLLDGYSTGGTPGTGLGAVKRAATRLDLWSLPGRGTAVMARLARPAAASSGAAGVSGSAAPRFEWGAVSVPIKGETVCGDGWEVSLRPDRISFVVADGLGHGILAAAAANAVLQLFGAHAGREPPAALLRRLHRGIAATRGAAVGVAEIARDGTELLFSGVGNIAAAVVSGADVRRAVSMNGIVGHAMARTNEFAYPFPPGALLVMTSDGLTNGWALDDYPGLALRHPRLIAALLYRDAARGRDDATVLVARRCA
jgi:anti-sigma regulatory factor (Ser/Thr protein kinase)